jgi:tetratricopeptide (TPR) repeat protein
MNQPRCQLSSHAPLAALVIVVALAAGGCSASRVGLEYYNQQNWEKAAPLLREAMIQEPDRRDEVRPYYVRSVINVADAMAAEGRFESALAEVRGAQEMARDDAELRKARIRYLLGFGQASLEAGNIDLARNQVEEVVRIEPSNVGARRLNGDIIQSVAENAIRLQRFDDALARYREYLKEFPDDVNVRRRAAQVYVVVGKRFAARGNSRQALQQYAEALRLDPSSEDAIRAAIVAADSTPRATIDNYRYFMGLLPDHTALRGRLQEQLERRILDALDSQNREDGLMFALGAWSIDTQNEARLAHHRGTILRIVEAQLKRSEVGAALATLREAASSIEPLAKEFAKIAENIRRDDEVFYVGLSDDITFLVQLQSTMIGEAEETTNPINRSNIQTMIRALDRQVDLLRNVRSRRNRLLISMNVFEVDPDGLARLEAAVSAEDFKTYVEFLDRYKRTQQLSLPR